MLSKLPRWIWIGGGFLACLAGMVNVIALLGLQHQAVSHVTGNSSQLSVSLVTKNYPMALHVFCVIGAFFIGSALSGMIVRDSALHFGQSYGVALILESLLLAIAIPFLNRHSNAGDYLASAACGLQNAMATNYSGAVIRTTHMTGIVTDLGIEAGRFLMGMGLDLKKIRLLGMIFSGFLIGSALGALGFDRFGYNTLAIPAALCGISGLMYVVVRKRHLNHHSGSAL